MLEMHKSKRTATRKLPFLPRVGLTVDFAGRHFAFRYAPMLETLMNVRERGFSVKNALSVLRAQLDEVGFPSLAPRKAVSVVEASGVETPAQRKAAPKAAAKRKGEPAASAPTEG
jgi:hypothetical protein